MGKKYVAAEICFWRGCDKLLFGAAALKAYGEQEERGVSRSDFAGGSFPCSPNKGCFLMRRQKGRFRSAGTGKRRFCPQGRANSALAERKRNLMKACPKAVFPRKCSQNVKRFENTFLRIMTGKKPIIRKGRHILAKAGGRRKKFCFSSCNCVFHMVY